MILPPSAFDDFCTINQVKFIKEEIKLQAGTEDWNWRLSDATRQRFKS